MRNRFDNQLAELNKELISMGALCENAIASVQATAMCPGLPALGSNLPSKAKRPLIAGASDAAISALRNASATVLDKSVPALPAAAGKPSTGGTLTPPRKPGSSSGLMPPPEPSATMYFTPARWSTALR